MSAEALKHVRYLFDLLHLSAMTNFGVSEMTDRRLVAAQFAKSAVFTEKCSMRWK